MSPSVFCQKLCSRGPLGGFLPGGLRLSRGPLGRFLPAVGSLLWQLVSARFFCGDALTFHAWFRELGDVAGTLPEASALA